LLQKRIYRTKKPDYGKIAIEGMISGVTETIKNVPKTIEIMSNKINESPKTKVWVEGKSLKECMGKSKLINSNTIQCHQGYFKEEE
jgi:hypothetical protein